LNLKTTYKNIAGLAISIIISLLIGAIFISFIGKDPLQIYCKILSETLGSDYGIGQVLFKATPLIFTGLAVAFAFEAGLFNIGAEGQLTIGAFATAWVAFALTGLPSILLIPISIIAGIIGGAIWGGIAGLLKAKTGSHEVINTIMMNFIAAALVSYLLNALFNVHGTIHTPEISPDAVIGRFDSIFGIFKGAPFNLSILIGLTCCVLMYYIIQKTPIGYEIKAMGFNKSAAEYAKINIKKLTLISMMISGGLAGLVGTNYVLGYKHYFELGFSEGTGYLGIAVALISKNNPFLIIFVSILFGLLEYGGLVINPEVPKELVTILQGIIILMAIIFSKMIEKNFKLSKSVLT